MPNETVKGFNVNINGTPTVVKYDYKSLDNNNDIAPEFSISSTYSVGQYVHYQGQLYKCIEDVNIAGSFDETKFVPIDIMTAIHGDISDANRKINDLCDNIILQYDEVVNGKYVNNAGNYADNVNRSVVVYNNIIPRTKLKFSHFNLPAGYNIACYDSNGLFIKTIDPPSRDSDNTFEMSEYLPYNAVTVKGTVHNNLLSSVSVEYVDYIDSNVDRRIEKNEHIYNLFNRSGGEYNNTTTPVTNPTGWGTGLKWIPNNSTGKDYTVDANYNFTEIIENVFESDIYVNYDYGNIAYIYNRI